MFCISQEIAQSIVQPSNKYNGKYRKHYILLLSNSNSNGGRSINNQFGKCNIVLKVYIDLRFVVTTITTDTTILITLQYFTYKYIYVYSMITRTILRLYIKQIIYKSRSLGWTVLNLGGYDPCSCMDNNAPKPENLNNGHRMCGGLILSLPLSVIWTTIKHKLYLYKIYTGQC